MNQNLVLKLTEHYHTHNESEPCVEVDRTLTTLIMNQNLVLKLTEHYHTHNESEPCVEVDRTLPHS
jgi:hypothetical protein